MFQIIVFSVELPLPIPDTRDSRVAGQHYDLQVGFLEFQFCINILLVSFLGHRSTCGFPCQICIYLQVYDHGHRWVFLAHTHLQAGFFGPPSNGKTSIVHYRTLLFFAIRFFYKTKVRFFFVILSTKSLSNLFASLRYC